MLRAAIVLSLVVSFLQDTPMPFKRIDRETARAVAAENLKLGTVDTKTFMQNAATLFKARGFDYSPGVLIYLDQGIMVSAQGPVAAYLVAVALAHQTKDKVDEATAWTTGVTISVAPTALTSLEIERITVKRNGVAVNSIGGDFEPLELGRSGSKRVRMGDVLYPLSAFEPGGDVVITLIPTSGPSIVKTLDQTSLRSLQ